MLISNFLPYVLPDVPGCPTAVAKAAVRLAAKEFLTDTGAWNEIQDPVTVVANAQEYDLEAPSGARCIDLKDIYTSCGRLTPKTIDQLSIVMPDWATAEGNIPAYYTRAFDFTTYRVFPKPTAPNGMVMRPHAVYTLLDTATAIPDEIVERYAEVIASGAKARLMTMPKVAWQDLQLAGYHKGVFEEGKSVARITAAHNKTSGAARAKPRRFGQ